MSHGMTNPENLIQGQPSFQLNIGMEILISRKTTVLEARAASVWAEVAALTVGEVEEVADAMTSAPTGGGTSKFPVIL